MKKTLCAILILLSMIFSLVSCNFSFSAEPTVTVSDDGYVVVNGKKTEHKVQTEDKITVSDDGYVIVNGVNTEYKVDKDAVVTLDNDGYVVVDGVKTIFKIHTKDEIWVSNNGYLVVNGTKTEYKVDKEAEVTVDDDGYVVVDGKKTPYKVEKSSSPTSTLPVYDGCAVTITFYHTMGAALRAVLDSSLKEFNKLYPNITVEHESLGSYDNLRDNININLAGGKQPNIVYCYPDHVVDYNASGAVLPLDDFINSTATIQRADGSFEIVGLTQAQQDDFVDAYWAEGKVFDTAGTMYTLPMAKSTEVLFYNKTFFDTFEETYKDGKGPLKVPTTWEEMEETCRRIKAVLPNSIPLGYDSESNWFITRLAQEGAGYTSIDSNNHYLFNNLTAVDILEEANEWYNDGLVKTTITNDAYTSNLFTLPSNTDNNKAFMVIGSTGGAIYQEPPMVDDQHLFEVGIAGIPQVNSASPKTIAQGPSLCLFKDSNPQEVAASWLLIKFLTTNVNFQCKFSIQSGYAPAIDSAKQDSIYKMWLAAANGFNNLQALCVKAAIDNEDSYFTPPAFNGSSKARSEAEKMMTDIMVYVGSDVREKAGSLLAAALANCKKYT